MGLKEIVLCPPKDELQSMAQFDKNISIISLACKEGISAESLINLHKNGYFDSIPLHEYLTNCELHFQPHSEEPRNPELEERVNKLKAEQANKEYRAMTKHFYAPERHNLSLGNEVKSVSAQLTAVINFALTVAGSFVFMFKAVEYALPVPNIAAQVMVGIITATVVALADLFFLVRTI